MVWTNFREVQNALFNKGICTLTWFTHLGETVGIFINASHFLIYSEKYKINGFVEKRIPHWSQM